MTNNLTMLRDLIIILLICSPYLSISQVQSIQKPPLTRILLIFDASNSMNGFWQSGKKIDIAKNIFTDFLDSLSRLAVTENLELALRIFGHQSSVIEKNCEDTRLEVPFSKGNIGKIKNVIKYINPKGYTPIAYSLERGAQDFPECDDCRNVIILITDGKEECGRDPCAVSLALQKKGVILKTFIIGIALQIDLKSVYECVGTFYDAQNEETFKSVLNIVITQTLNPTTTQVNLLDIYGNPTETNVPMTFYDHLSHKPRYGFVHTMNNKGNPDTLRLDHLTTYDLVVYTVPPVRKDSIKITPGIHNIIGIESPQGYLLLKVKEKNESKNLQCIVRKSGEMKTLNVQNFDEPERYIVGKYSLEILSLPRIILEDIEISQNKTTTVEIPQPGIVTLQMSASGYGCILVEEERGKELKWVCNISTNATHQSFVLQPGNYVLIYRSKNSKETLYSIKKRFTVTSGGSQLIKLY